MTEDEAAAALEGSGLSEDQAAAARILLSTDRAVLAFVGPAGTGKSHTLAAFAAAHERQTGGRVIGLALSTNASRVLATEGLAETHTIADFLGKLEGTDRDPGAPAGARRRRRWSSTRRRRSAPTTWPPSRPPCRPRRRPGDPRRRHRAADQPRGGRHDGPDSPRPRIRAGARGAPVPPRRGKARPACGCARATRACIADYRRHGRIREGRQDDVRAAAVRLWLGDHLAGEDTLLIAGTNQEAAELAHDVRPGADPAGPRRPVRRHRPV